MEDEKQKSEFLMISPCDFISTSIKFMDEFLKRFLTEDEYIEFLSMKHSDKVQRNTFFINNEGEPQFIFIQFDNRYKMWCFPLLIERMSSVKGIISLTDWNFNETYENIVHCSEQNNFRKFYEGTSIIYSEHLDRFAVVPLTE